MQINGDGLRSVGLCDDRGEGGSDKTRIFFVW